MDERAQRALRVAAILFLLSLVVFAKFHEPTRFVHALQKLAHAVTFGAVALLFLTLLRRQTPRRFGSYLAAFVLTVLCGAGTEVAQAFAGRDPSILDVLRDALGASSALAAFATLVPGADARGRGGWRVTGALACSPLDRYFLVGGGAEMNLVPSTGPTTSPCGSALRVEFGTAPYAGIMLEEPYPDWRTAHTLVLELRNPGDLDLPLALRVHDRAHNLKFRDRINREFTLRGHERLEIAIPIAEIEHAPADRLMDLSRIAGVAVFRDRGTMVGNFEVERILLRR